GDVSVCPDGLLHFGDSVIIHAPVVQPRKGCPKSSFPCTLAATPPRHDLYKNIYLDSPITACPHYHQPVVKNVFTITPRSSNFEEGSILCYGDSFDLVHVAVNGEQLYVTSPVGSALHSARESRRQEVLLKKSSSAHSAWRLQPYDPTLRLPFDGQPVEVGSRIQLVQSMTNQPVVVEEEFTTNTIFGQEQEVSVGVVNRATTRAASILAFLTWTRRTPEKKEEETEEILEEDVVQKEREIQEKIVEEIEEKKREEETREEENVEGIRLVLDNSDESPSDEKLNHEDNGNNDHDGEAE
ncbi:hypothetical protein SK128_016051, partial [Halocaridina rubra]